MAMFTGIGRCVGTTHDGKKVVILRQAGSQGQIEARTAVLARPEVLRLGRSLWRIEVGTEWRERRLIATCI
jgi:hypothetical protein